MRFCLNKAETIVAVITVQSVRRVRLKKKRMQAEKCARQGMRRTSRS